MQELLRIEATKLSDLQGTASVTNHNKKISFRNQLNGEAYAILSHYFL